MSQENVITLGVKEAALIEFCLIDRKTRLGVNLDGKIVTFTVRAAIDDPTIEIQKVTGTGITHAPDQTATPGVFDLQLNPTDTDLGAFEHVWDLWVDDVIWVRASPFIVELTVRKP